MAEPQSLPWLYPYREDPQSERLGEPVFRPFVYVSLACGEQNTTLLEGLIDTGADAVLASDLLAEQLGIDLADNEGENCGGLNRLRQLLTADYASLTFAALGPLSPGSAS